MAEQFGILQVKTPAQVTAEMMAKEQAANAVRSPMIAVIDNLSSFMDREFVNAKEANREPRAQMLKNLRQCKGEYESQKLAAIRELKGSEAFIGLTEKKCQDIEGWLLELYGMGSERPWGADPTPVSDLPDETMETVSAEVMAEAQRIFQQIQAMAQMSGQPIDLNNVKKYLRDYAMDRKIQALRDIQDEAKERSGRMEKAIEDQLTEGGFDRVLADFLWYLSRLKASIIKGPVVRIRKREKWQNGELVYVDEYFPDVECPSPFNIFPTKDTITPGNGGIFEVHKFSRQDFFSLIGVENYSETEIRAILSDFDTGSLAKWLQIDDQDEVEKAEKEAKNLSFMPTSLVYALEYTGTLPGKYLQEWMDSAQPKPKEGEAASNIDPERQYLCNCWKVGKHVFRAVINPDPLGRSLYKVTSLYRTPGSFWGKGAPEALSALQDICNSIVRAGQNNIAFASGPFIEQNIDRCDDTSPLWPLKRFFATESQINDTPALRFYQPDMHIGELMNAYQFFSAIADDLTVPAYAHGNPNIGGAGNTVGGFTMLMNGASRNIRLMANNIDIDVIAPLISDYNRYNLRYNPDDTLKGDVRIVAKGAAIQLQKERMAARVNEMARTVANPVFTPAMGAEGTKYLLKELANTHDMDPRKLCPEGKGAELVEMLQKIFPPQQQLPGGGAGGPMDPAQMSGQVQAGGSPPNPMNLDPVGLEQGGPEFQKG